MTAEAQATATALWPIPIQLITTTISELQSQGFSAAEVLEGSDIEEQALHVPGTLLPYRTAYKILSRALELNTRDDLGLIIGNQQSPSSFGLLGYGINCCATCEDALNMAVKYHRVSSTLLNPTWQRHEDRVSWLTSPPIPLGELLRFSVEEEFSSFCRAHHLLTGQPLHILEAHFQYPQPDCIISYQELFDCPLFFGAETNQLVSSPELLQRPILQANPLSLAAAEQICSDFLKANPTTDDLALSVRQLILTKQNEFLDESAVAQQLHITSRTLRNRLRQCGTSYQQILDSIREQIAKHDLSNSSLSCADIAERLGYSDSRSFRRAFKKWTGLSPDGFRKQVKSSTP